MKKIIGLILFVLVCLCGCQNQNSEEPTKGLKYELSYDQTYYEVSGIGTANTSKIVIPQTYNNLPVNGIAFSAFRKCKDIMEVVIPEGVTYIGLEAFSKCYNLKTVELPQSLTRINSYAFGECSYLQNIVIPSNVEVIEADAFYGCSYLKSITIPKSVTKIGGNPFTYCTNLNSIVVEEDNTIYDSRNNCNAIIETVSNTLISGCQNTIIPNDITEIGDSAFRGLSIESISLPQNLQSIRRRAFANCNNIISMTLPESVTSIEEYAFSECVNLKNINLPRNIKSIKAHLFDNCTSLESIIIPSGVFSIESYAFNNCTSLKIVYNASKIKLEVGSTNYGSIALYATNVYNNGEWNYVDGIPTPIK